MSGTLREHVSHACVLTQGALDRLQQPTVVAGQRVSALRFGDPRVMALSQAITGFTHLPRGFRNRDLRPHVEALRGSSVFGRADDLRPSTPSTQGSDPSDSENAPVYRDQLRPEGRLLLRQTLSAHLSPELGGADPHRRPLPTRTPRRPRCPRSRNPKAARGGRTCCLQNLLQPLRSSPLEMSRAVCRA